MNRLFKENGEKVFLTDEVVGGGAESDIYNIHGDSKIVAKIYKKASSFKEKEEKLKYMISHYPDGSGQMPLKVSIQGRTEEVVVIAWPIHLLYNEHNNFVGFTMPKINYSMAFSRFIIPKIRERYYGSLSNKQITKVARNLAIIFENIHKINCLICDSNETNFFIDRNGFVVLIDTDSFQIRTETNKLLKSQCYTPENSPPEYLNVRIPEFTEFGDRFILAVMIFRLLMDGFHPFQGIPLPNSRITKTQDLEQVCIKKGWYPYEKNGYIQPPADAPKYIEFYEVKNAFYNCFIKGYDNAKMRPSASEWISVIDKYIGSSVVNDIRSYQRAIYSAIKICPFVMVLDVTPSLSKYYDDLQNGYNMMINQLKESDASSRIEFCLVEFADPPEIITNFQRMDESHQIRLRGDYTKIGEALNVALKVLTRRLRHYKDKSISYYKPNIVLITDGLPDVHDEKNISLAIDQSRFYNVHCVSVGNLTNTSDDIKQQNILKNISTFNTVHKLKETKDFASFFNWLSVSVSIGNRNFLI